MTWITSREGFHYLIIAGNDTGHIELAGTTPDMYDQLIVTDTFTTRGSIELLLPNDFLAEL